MARRSRTSGSTLAIANWRDRSHPQAGGAETVCEELAKRFASRGYKVVLLTASADGRPEREQRDGYTVIRRGGRFTVYAHALMWLARRRNTIAGVVDSQNGIPFFTPLVLPHATPIVMLLHHVHQDQFAKYLSPPIAAIARWLERTGSRLVYGSRTVIAVSPSTREGARSQLHLRGDLFVAPPGSTPLPHPVMERGSLRSERPRIVCVGRLVPHKRTSRVVEAMPALLREFSQLELHVVGDGPERPELESLVTRLGVDGNVYLHGAVSSEARDALLSTAWLTINASQGEGWGLSIVEAHALGVPALAFRRPGVRDSIRDGETGWLLDDDASLAEAVAAALRELADPARAHQLSAQARAWVARFTWDDMTERVLASLEAESGRLANDRDERRARTDLAAIVHLPTEAIPDGWQPRFRLTDRWIVDEGGLAVLLPGADTQSALVALQRAGLPRDVTEHLPARPEVARPAHYLSPAVSAPPPIAAQVAARGG